MKAQGSILLTGATGFVGQALLERLLENQSHKVIVALRSENSFDRCAAHVVGNFSRATDWSVPLSNQNVVIHAAARTNIMKDEVADPLAEYRRVNVEATLNLARQAAVAGVKRFIFISSIKVNGVQAPLGRPFTADDEPAPADPYGVSKWEAEQELLKLATETEMEVVIIRPPLIYGPGVKGNFAALAKLVEKGVPMPLGAINNQRSLVGLDNLVDLTITCIDHPAAANQIFLAGDGQDLSTTALLRCVASAMGKPARLIAVPVSLLMFGATLLGKKDKALRLLGSLQVDISKTRELLSWEPPVSIEDGLRRCFVTQIR